MKKSIHFFLLSTLTLTSTILSQENSKSIVSIHEENDIVAGRDFDYTNGFFIQYISKDLNSSELPKFTSFIRNNIRSFDQDAYQNNIGIGFGQSMYTPTEIKDPNLRPNDRPYAGFTYLSFSLHHKNAFNLHKIQLKLGIIGPWSLAEDTQKMIHEIISAKEPMGWDHQLNNELGLGLSYEYRKRYPIYKKNIDIISSVKLSLGNVETYASTGATLRLGYNLPHDFHSNRINYSGYALPTNYKSNDNFSCYVFGTSTNYAVAVDIFLDGNTFEDSHSVDKENLRAEFEVGIGISYKNFFMTYTRVFETRRYKTQSNNPTYGSLNIGYKF